MQRRLWGQGDDATMGWELRMLWRKGVGSSRGGGGSVICADMREHCCAERGGVPIGGGLGGVRCRARDASVARDARAQFQQAAPYASTIQIDHRRQAVRVLIRMYCREQSYASDVRVIYSCTRTTNCFCTVVRVIYSCIRTAVLGISTVVRAGK